MGAHLRRPGSEWVAFGVSVATIVLLTLVAATALRGAERAADQARLDGATASFASVLTTEIERLGDAGTDVGVALSLVPDLDPSRYEELMELLIIDERFPGVYGIALVTDGGEELLRIVTYHHPLPANQAAIGIDLSPRGASRVAADLALSSGRPVLSDATVIQQLDRAEPGAVLHVPVPRGAGLRPATIGVVISGQRFVEGLSPLPTDVAVRVTDPTSTTFTRLATLGDQGSPGSLTAEVDVQAVGKTWRLSAVAEPDFTLPWYQRGSSALALGGAVAALFFGLFVRSLATRERVASELVEQRTAELSSVNDRLADTNLALADASRAKDAFLASVSHELRTPLTVIAGFVETLQRLPDGSPDGPAFIDPIERNVRRLDGLVSDLLTITSLDARAVTAFRRCIDLQAVLPALPTVLAGVVDEITVTVEPGCDVEVDPRHLDRIVVNLLVNAQRHGRPPTELSAGPAGPDHVEIRVRDHGLGIEAGELDRLFERFARGDDRGNVPGTGLGLAIVRELAQLNGGEIRYEPADPGACFVVRLERATAPALPR